MAFEFNPGNETRDLESSTQAGYQKGGEFNRMKERLQYRTNRDSMHVPNDSGTSVQQMPAHLDNMPSVNSPSNNVQDSARSSEQLQFVKHEPTETPKSAGEAQKLDDERLHDQNLVSEEPLEIQCGENSALLYVSKLCQGSKGPCILYKSEWLTPNELQYISGRETAKDWKRSIRYKGKSLKSLIGRGLIKVHPPICDCLGCRISSPVNRGRLASKCSLSPTSPRKRRESFKSSPAWQADGSVDPIVSHRHFSASDLDHFHSSSKNGLPELSSSRESSSSTSDCSEPADESPFSPVNKRARSSSPENFEKTAAITRRRRSDSSHSLFLNTAIRDRLQYDAPGSPLLVRHSKEDFRTSNGNSPSAQAQQGHRVKQEDQGHSREQSIDSSEGRSAFKTVFQDDAPNASGEHSAGQMTSSEGTPDMQADVAMRSSKARSKPTRLPSTSFVPPFTQSAPPATLVSPAHNSPRLVSDSVFLPNPHGANIYHHALRAGYPAVPPIPQSLLHYRLLSPTAAAQQAAHAHAAMAQSLSIQNALLSPDHTTKRGLSPNHFMGGHSHVDTTKASKSPLHPGNESRKNTPDKNLSTTEDASREIAKQGSEATRPDESKSGIEQIQERGSVIQKSPISSPGVTDEHSNTSLQKRYNTKDDRTFIAEQLLPTVKVDLNENVFKWTVDDVCHFVETLTECHEVEQIFRENQIDGQALVLLREEHLLNRMAIKLGPALKVLAQVNKLIENLRDDLKS